MMVINKKKDSPRWLRNRTQCDAGAENGTGLFARAVFYLLLACFLGVSVYVFVFSPFMRVSVVIVEGNDELNGDEVRNTIQAKLDGKYLGFLPKDNYLFISPRRTGNLVAELFKKIKTVEVEKIFPNQVIIRLQERKSLLVWCSNESCYLVDEQGMAYQAADFGSSEIQENHLLKIVQGDGKQVGMGTQVMDVEMVKYYGSLREVFEQRAGVKLNEEVSINSRLAEDGTVKATQGFEVLVNFSIPVERSAELMKTFLNKQYKGQDLNNLAYVDLRVENKIFYKTK